MAIKQFFPLVVILLVQIKTHLDEPPWKRSYSLGFLELPRAIRQFPEIVNDDDLPNQLSDLSLLAWKPRQPKDLNIPREHLWRRMCF